VTDQGPATFCRRDKVRLDQAGSLKLQATSYKLQATSYKRLRHFGEFIKDKNMLVYGINQPGEKHVS